MTEKSLSDEQTGNDLLIEAQKEIEQSIKTEQGPGTSSKTMSETSEKDKQEEPIIIETDTEDRESGEENTKEIKYANNKKQIKK